MEEKVCKHAHCETDQWGSELCCGKRGNRYCVFDRRTPYIDYSKCGLADLVSVGEWKKHAAEMGW